MPVQVDFSEVLDLEGFIADMPERTRKAAALAINEVISGPGLAIYRDAVAEQINVPRSYLNDDRLGVTQYATPSRLEGRITGRQRATSLARFATSGAVGAKGGVSVRVKRSGGSRFMKSAFLVRLKAGSSLTDGSNTGLAVRLKPGQTIINKRETANMVHLDTNVVLLYGPSIDQVLRVDVAQTETPRVADKIVQEFYRQFARSNIRG